MGLPPSGTQGQYSERTYKSRIITAVNPSSPCVLHYIFLIRKVKNNKRHFWVPPSRGRLDLWLLPASLAPNRTSPVGDAAKGRAPLRTRWLDLVTLGLCVLDPARLPRCASVWKHRTREEPRRRFSVGVPLIVHDRRNVVATFRSGQPHFQRPRPQSLCGNGDRSKGGNSSVWDLVLPLTPTLWAVEGVGDS